MTRATLAAGLALSIAGCAMTMNGKPVGFGGGAASADTHAATDASAPAGSSGDGQDTGHYKDYPRYPAAPIDPWSQVKDGEPIRVESTWAVRASPYDCTARHDHCLDEHIWFWETDKSRDGKPERRKVGLGALGEDRPTAPANSMSSHVIEDGPYTGYKTVPATRRNLRAGVLVVALGYPYVTPADGGAARDLPWHIGVVDRVDWDLAKIYFVGAEDDSLAIAATRVAVLAWRPGEKVAVVAGVSRDQIQVKPDEVILPDPQAP